MEPAPVKDAEHLRGNIMADGNSGNGALYFIVGALCVAVAVGAFFMFGGNLGQSTAQAPAPATAPAAAPTKNVTIERVEKIETPKVIERTERR
jgi:hypothetical protein